MAAWISLFDCGRATYSAAEHCRSTRASRPCLMTLGSITASMLVLAATLGMAADRQSTQLAAMCASCHRLDGRDKGIPSIVGLDQKQFVDVMAAFKSGERSSQIMHTIALSLSDGEVSALAAYLSVQPAGTKQR